MRNTIFYAKSLSFYAKSPKMSGFGKMLSLFISAMWNARELWNAREIAECEAYPWRVATDKEMRSGKG